MFNRLSIRNKFALILWGAALLAFTVVGVALSLFDNLTMKERIRQLMEPYAQLVSVGADTAVAFEDPIRAQEILDSLRANAQIMEAAIILENGRVLASFGQASSNASPHFDPRLASGLRIEKDTAQLIHNLPHGGHLSLTMSLEQLGRQTRRAFWMFGVAMLVLLSITLAQWAVLQRAIIRPMARLVEAAELVRSRSDCKVNLPVNGTDEVARLGRSFTAMMEAVRAREHELRQLTLLQRTILDNAAYGIISTTVDGVVNSFNPAAERLLGYPADEVIGRRTPVSWHDPEELALSARQLSIEFDETIQPDFEVFRARARHHLADEHEWTFIRKDGARLVVLLSVTALRNEQGEVTGFVGLFSDLTARKKTEAALQEKTAELDRYFTNALDLLCIADTEGYFRRLNPAWETVLGFSISELEGRRFLDFVHPDDLEATRQSIARLARQQEVLNFSNRYRSKNGAYRWIEWRSFPSGRLIYAAAHDITEQKRAEAEILKLNRDLEQRVALRTAQLETANKELEAFAYSVSHDLRAPLRGIDGFSQALLEDYEGKLDETGKLYLNRVRAGAQRMAKLIDDMLGLSRITRSEMCLEEVDLSKLVGEIAVELGQRAPDRIVTWIIAPVAKATGDAGLLRMVLENLLGNAWKFTGKRTEATIEFGVTENADASEFFVRDNGAGFDMRYADKLFKAFQRLHTSEEFPGTGIGMATVQRIIQRHGGKVRAEGRVGLGATFWFSLPHAVSKSSIETGAS